MPRDGAGNYALPNGYLATANTTILDTQHNAPLEDIAQALTDSLPRSGVAPMTGALTLVNADPTLANHATRKSYVDALAAASTPADNSVTTAKIATGAVTPAKMALGTWTNVAGATTVDLGAQTSRNLVLTGTGWLLSSFGTTGTADGLVINIRIGAGASGTIVNGANLICLGGANISAVAGDIFQMVWEGSNVWRMIGYERASGAALVVSNQILTAGTAVATTSGTSIDFTGIPSWVRRLTFMFQGVSTNGSSNLVLRVGSGSITATGYLGATVVNIQGATPTGNLYSTGIEILSQAGATDVWHGAVIFSLVASNQWAVSGAVGLSNSIRVAVIGGTTPALGGALDRIRLTTVGGSDTFDAGSVNILYE